MRLLFLLFIFLFGVHHLFIFIFTHSAPLTASDLLSLVLADISAALFLSLLFQYLGKTRAYFFRILLYTFSFLFVLFLLMTFGFARLYERVFTWSFVRLDSLSIWKENFISALYELNITDAFLFVTLLILLSVAIFLARKARPLRLRSIFFTGITILLVGFLSYSFLPQQVNTLSNPVIAAFQKKKVRSEDNARVTADDTIPELDSLTGGFVKAPEVTRKAGKNVILYFLESTPYSVIGQKIQNKEITPSLNAFKKESLFFERHYANFPLSINAFYSSLCGAYALPDGAWVSLSLPDFPVPCLSQILKKHGYRILALHAGYLTYAKQKRFMLKRGFDFMADAETIKKPPYEKGMGPWGAADERAMIQPLVNFINANAEKPFMAVLFAFAPHHPYSIPDDFPEFITERGALKKQHRDYFNSLHFADMAFGKIRDALQKNGALENTVILVFGDHGEAFYEHRGNYNHPFFIYEENVHVPFFLWYKGITPATLERVTSHVDILPTVLDILNLSKEITPYHVGRSMLKGGAQTMAHLQAYWNEELSGIVDNHYKFIRKETGETELYNLLNDKEEKKNIANEIPELTAAYNQQTLKAFAQKKAYYKKYAQYDLVRFKPSSQDK
ncbi:MAG TPA: LTA synthase family protein [Turneriella sp.]|nr:LTA synthase family protein [Turneriella sp.]